MIIHHLVESSLLEVNDAGNISSCFVQFQKRKLKEKDDRIVRKLLSITKCVG